MLQDDRLQLQSRLPTPLAIELGIMMNCVLAHGGHGVEPEVEIPSFLLAPGAKPCTIFTVRRTAIHHEAVARV
jgi:hypothetical protein